MAPGFWRQLHVHAGVHHCRLRLLPDELGPVVPGPGVKLLPKLYDLSQKAGMPFCGYFSCGTDGVMSG